MPDVLLLRHGESEWNRLNRYQGIADPPLTPLGEEQSRLAAEALLAIDQIVSSDLQRAQRTADLLAEALGIEPVVVEPGLRERDTGEWTGLTRQQIEREWPNGTADPPPGWEDDAAVLARVEPALLRIAARGRTVAVTHAGVIRAVERRLGQPWAPLANLAGRWVHVDGDRLRAGERVVLIDADDERLTVPLET